MKSNHLKMAVAVLTKRPHNRHFIASKILRICKMNINFRHQLTESSSIPAGYVDQTPNGEHSTGLLSVGDWPSEPTASAVYSTVVRGT